MIHGRRLEDTVTVTNLEDDPLLTDEFGHALEIEVVTEVKGLMVLRGSSENQGQKDRDTTHTQWNGFFFPNAPIAFDSVLHWTDKFGTDRVGHVDGDPLHYATRRGIHHIEVPVEEYSTDE